MTNALEDHESTINIGGRTITNLHLADDIGGETCPYHCSLHLFRMVRRSSRSPIVCWILARTSSLVSWSLYEMHSILRYHLISLACFLLWSSAVRVHDSPAYRKMDVTRERISRITSNWFQPCQCCCCLCYPGEYLRLRTLIGYNCAQACLAVVD